MARSTRGTWQILRQRNRLPIVGKLFFIFLLVLFSFSLAFAENFKPAGEIGLYKSIYLESDDGNISAVYDYSSTPTNFSFTPAAGEVFRIGKLLVEVEDVQINSEDDYGGIANGLTNGFDIFLKKDGVLYDISAENNGNIKKNSDWHGLAYDVEYFDTKAGDHFLNVRWRFSDSGTYLRLDGDENDALFITFNDDLTGLVSHKFLIKGYLELEEEADNMTFIGFIIAIGFIAYMCFFLATSVKIQKVPKGRVLEKVLFQMLGLIFLFGLSVLLVVQVQSVAALAHLLVFANVVLGIVTTFCLVLAYAHIYYIVTKHIRGLSQAESAKEEDETQ